MGCNPFISPDCNQNKDVEERLWLSQQQQAACDPLSAGWLPLKQQDLEGEVYCEPRPKSGSARPKSTLDLSDPRHMHQVWEEVHDKMGNKVKRYFLFDKD